MAGLGSELARLNYELEEEVVTVVPLQDYKDLRFDGMHYNLVEERESQIPLWIAEILEEKGIVRIQTENNATYKILRTIARQEQNLPTLTQLDSLLYHRVKLEIENLTNQGTPMALRRLTSIEGSLNTILRLRSRKILGLVRDDEGNYSQTNMTAEEEWLFKRLNDVYTSWKKKIGVSLLKEEN